MADVEAKRTDFTSLLVYDVSRWGPEAAQWSDLGRLSFPEPQLLHGARQACSDRGSCMNEKLIESLSIAQIHIANPRARNRPRWQMMVANIREVGLKKPITVVRRSATGQDGGLFDLVCGQGRIEMGS